MKNSLTLTYGKTFIGINSGGSAAPAMSLSEVRCQNNLNFSTMMSSLSTTRAMISSPPAITAITSSVSAARANIGKTQTVFSMQTFGMSAR